MAPWLLRYCNDNRYFPSSSPSRRRQLANRLLCAAPQGLRYLLRRPSPHGHSRGIIRRALAGFGALPAMLSTRNLLPLRDMFPRRNFRRHAFPVYFSSGSNASLTTGHMTRISTHYQRYSEVFSLLIIFITITLTHDTSLSSSLSALFLRATTTERQTPNKALTSKIGASVI